MKMEKIFKDHPLDVLDKFRFGVKDDGFSTEVMAQIAAIARPSPNSYRAPTIIAAAMVTLSIVTLSVLVGVDQLTRNYESITSSISSSLCDETSTVHDQSIDNKGNDQTLENIF